MRPDDCDCDYDSQCDIHALQSKVRELEDRIEALERKRKGREV